jgi:protein-disulfide isomerase
MLGWILWLGFLSGLVVQSGCGGDPQELAELRDQQRQILAKLADIEKKIDQAARIPARETGQAARSGPDPDRVHSIPVDRSPFRGPADAPVTIVEFSDYQCPFCARMEPLIMQVLAEYDGKARFVYKHLPLVSIHPQALPAARAAAAAQQQGKFWEMHELLFKNPRALQPDDLKSYARQIGLDVQRFEADMQAPESETLVREDMRVAQQLGVRGTPTLFVNGRLLRDRSLQGFKRMIDPLLERADD